MAAGTLLHHAARCRRCAASLKVIGRSGHCCCRPQSQSHRLKDSETAAKRTACPFCRPQRPDAKSPPRPAPAGSRPVPASIRARLRASCTDSRYKSVCFPFFEQGGQLLSAVSALRYSRNNGVYSRPASAAGPAGSEEGARLAHKDSAPPPRRRPLKGLDMGGEQVPRDAQLLPVGALFKLLLLEGQLAPEPFYAAADQA